MAIFHINFFFSSFSKKKKKKLFFHNCRDPCDLMILNNFIHIEKLSSNLPFLLILL